jgi:hypothetical protein
VGDFGPCEADIVIFKSIAGGRVRVAMCMTSFGIDAHACALFGLFALDFQPNSKFNFKNLKADLGIPRAIKISILILKYVL